MHKPEVDISVLMLFFNRPKQLKKVFAEVKKARPARLFLYQDGPRGERDMKGILVLLVVSLVNFQIVKVRILRYLRYL